MQPVTYYTDDRLPHSGEKYRGPGAKLWLLHLIEQKTSARQQAGVVYNMLHTPNVLFSEISPGSRRSGNDVSKRAAIQENLLFGKYTFPETVGLWLKHSGSATGGLLSPFISTDGFTFTPEEFLDLRSRLRLTRRNYAKLPRAAAALENLNTGFFRHQSLEESRSFLDDRLTVFLGRARVLTRKYLEAVNGYARRSATKRRRELSRQENALKELFGMLPEAPDRKTRRQQTTALRDTWASYTASWHVEDAAAKELPSEDQLKAEVQRIAESRNQLNRELASASLSLSHLTVSPEVGNPDEFKQLADELDLLVREIDEAGIYQLPLSGGTAATASRQLQRLESILQQLTVSFQHLPELDGFYARRHFWYAQPARLRRLLAPLLDLPDADWETAFASWYFDRCLERSKNPDRDQLRPAALAGLLKEGQPVTNGDVTNGVSWLQRGDKVSPEIEVLVDFTGGERPAGYPGAFYSLCPLGDREATHLALAGALDPRLTLLQSFVPMQPAKWLAIPVSAPPAGSDGRLCVQLEENGPWQLYTDWAVCRTDHLRIYLAPKVSGEAGEKFLREFDGILLAAARITIYHSWSQNDITQALLSDGLNANFLAAILLRAAEACAEVPFDGDALAAVGREVRTRCGIPAPERHPLAEALLPLLRRRLPDHFFEVHQAWRDTYLPLVVLSPQGRKTVLLPGGRLPGSTDDDFTEALRQRELATAGLSCLEIDALACWEDVAAEVDRLVGLLQ